MIIKQDYAIRNTFGLQVKARWFMEYASVDDLQHILHDEYFHELPSLHVGQGSNLLFLNDVAGVVLHSAIKGIEVAEETDESALLRIGAAEIWDDVVAYAVQKGWGGIENLSLIPGEAGAAAVQNIGAYGVEIKDVIETVEAYNQRTAENHIFTREACLYDYRHSFFKDERHDPYIVTHVTLRLMKPSVYRPKYGYLKAQLSAMDAFAPSGVREAVIRVRRQKLPDPAALGNAGSFFKNPMVTHAHAERLRQDYPDMPSFPTKSGMTKLSAAWLIEQCGWKGKRLGNAGTYPHQALVIVNYGQVTGKQIALFAEQIRKDVEQRFGVLLHPEVKYIG